MRHDTVSNLVIGMLAFLTLVDLFATQAILPALVTRYHATPAAMGFAVNASTFGMAMAGVAVSAFSRRIHRRKGVVLSLALLSIPTALLSVAPDLTSFTALRVTQGLLMSTAFSLTLAYLAENCDARATGGAFAAYITGNVASNLFGRLISAAAADHFGLSATFLLFALLNVAGAVLSFVSLQRKAPLPSTDSMRLVTLEHLGNPALRVAFAIGFLILFAFIGTFTYVNFVLVRPPFAIGMMKVGLVYFVFLPSIFTTPLAGRAVRAFGTRPAFWSGLVLAGLGLPLLLAASLPAVLGGLALVGVGTFFAQAVATGFVGRAAMGDRGSAGGLYLASYFLGGLVGSSVLGALFDRFGWASCVTGVGLALGMAALLAFRLRTGRAMEMHPWHTGQEHEQPQVS